MPFATLEDKYQLLDDGTLAPTLTLPHEGGGNSIAARKRIRFAFRTPDEVTFTYPDGPPVVFESVEVTELSCGRSPDPSSAGARRPSHSARIS